MRYSCTHSVLIQVSESNNDDDDDELDGRRLESHVTWN